MTKKILRIVLFLLIAVPMIATAQELAVTEFSLDDKDLTANLKGTTKYDQNGEKCALIKIFTTATGFTFDVGSLGVADIVQKPGEIWLYVPSGIRRITINHPQLGMCDYDFTIPITKARTYRMKLVAGQVQTIVKQARTSQYVVFNVIPSDASIEINGQVMQARDGGLSKRMPFGTYDYKVQAPRYYAKTGRIIVNDPNNKHIVNIELEPAFSIVNMSVDADAEIWIDEVKRGTRVFKGELAYGTYLVECRQAGHRSSQTELTITPENISQTITLPSPIPIYGSIDVNSSPVDADIYVDGKKIGNSPMYIQDMLVGQHKIRISKLGYSDYIANVVIDEGKVYEINATLQNRKESKNSSQDLEKHVLNYGLKGNYKKMLKILEKLEEQEGQNEQITHVKLQAGNLLLNNGRKEDALKIFTNVLKDSPNNAQAQMSLMDFYSVTSNQQKADSLLECLLVNPSINDETRIILLDKWKKTKKGASIADTKNLYRKVLDAAPENKEIRLQFIQLLSDDTLDDNFIGECSKALEYIPGEVMLYIYLGFAQFVNGHTEDAINSLKSGVANKKPDTPKSLMGNIYSILGDAYHKIGDKKASYEAYDSCLVYTPDHAVCLNNYAYYLSAEKEDLKKAEQMSYKAITAESNNAIYLDTYAWILYQEGNYADAKIYIDMAMEKLETKEENEDNKVIFEHLREIYKKNQ